MHTPLNAQIRIHTHKPLNLQKPYRHANPYTYAQATYRAKFVQPTKIRIRTHNLIKAQNPYNLQKDAYIAQRRTQMCEKSVQHIQIRIQLSNQSTTDVFGQINK